MKYIPETGFLYSSGIITDFVRETRFLLKYTPETGFLYSSGIITDSVQETRFFAIYIYAGKPVAEGRGDTPQ